MTIYLIEFKFKITDFYKDTIVLELIFSEVLLYLALSDFFLKVTNQCK